jgi:Uma2 family endonuclease
MTIATATNLQNNSQPLLLDVSNTILTVTSEQFDRLCIDNPHLQLELTPHGELIVTAPTPESRDNKFNLAIEPGKVNKYNVDRFFNVELIHELTDRLRDMRMI